MQYGFLKNRSTTDAVLKVMDYMYEEFNENKKCVSLPEFGKRLQHF